MTKKFKYLRLSALYHLMDGLSFDVPACAEVLESALAQLNLLNGLPDSIVQWNRRGGHASGPLKLSGKGGAIIEVTESFSPTHGKMHMATVLENKNEAERPPTVFLSMRSIALDIPMRVEIPMRTLLRGGTDLAGTYVVYLHVLLSDDDKDFVYYGITKRGWNLRFEEHMKAALKTKQARLFPQKLADLIDARVAQRAGKQDERQKLAGVVTTLCAVGLDEDMAKDTEEYLVDKYSLASKHPLGLNMIPGGREGIRVLHQMSGRSPDSLVETEGREMAFVEYRERHPQIGLQNPGVAMAWNDPAYAEAVICGRENRLSANQVREIRYLAATGQNLALIKAAVGVVDDGQVRRVLSGRTYSRIL